MDSYQEIFREYAPGLYHFCLRLTGDQADAQDVVQEIFLRLWERRGDLGDVRNLDTYIKTVARNHIYDMFRRRLVEHRHSDRIRSSFRQYASPEQELDIKDLRELILKSAGKLSAQQREILILRSKDFSNEEIAGLLGISKRTVEAHLGKAYKSLREDLGDLGEILPAIVLVISSL